MSIILTKVILAVIVFALLIFVFSKISFYTGLFFYMYGKTVSIIIIFILFAVIVYNMYLKNKGDTIKKEKVDTKNPRIVKKTYLGTLVMNNPNYVEPSENKQNVYEESLDEALGEEPLTNCKEVEEPLTKNEEVKEPLTEMEDLIENDIREEVPVQPVKPVKFVRSVDSD